MWVIAMFDLPVVTKIDRQRYTKFRRALLDDSFVMLQYSVYGRPCPSEENARVHSANVKQAMPPDGAVRVLMLTDMQFARMEVFVGKKRVKTEKSPDQLMLF